MKFVKSTAKISLKLVGVVGLSVAILSLGVLTYSYLSGDRSDRVEIVSSIKSLVG